MATMTATTSSVARPATATPVIRRRLDGIGTSIGDAVAGLVMAHEGIFLHPARRDADGSTTRPGLAGAGE